MGVGVGRPTACGIDAKRQSSLSRSRPRSLCFRGWGSNGELVGVLTVADGSTGLPLISSIVFVLLSGNASDMGEIVGRKTGTLGWGTW